YRLIYVPAVSGESIANAYQRNLVELANHIYRKQNKKPPLTDWDLRHEFCKFMDDRHLTSSLAQIVSGASSTNIIDLKHDFEKKAIEESIVADVGGFLYAERVPVKRTSRLYTSYLLPTYDAIEVTAIEAQFHARQMPSETVGREAEASSKASSREAEGGAEVKKEEVTKAQKIYYVEVATALYGLTLALDLDGIGRTSLVKVENAVDPDERFRRIKVATGAMGALFTGQGFGAKLTRFMPVKKVVSAIAVLSDPTPFMVTPPQYPDYIENTISRVKDHCMFLEKLGLEPRYTVIVLDRLSESLKSVNVPQSEKPGSSKCVVEVVDVNRIESLFQKVLEKIDAQLSREGK
ncbi:MAG: DevR family CRISPR-associated autoregulator, partial [Sulfolobales archaeon]|nr:DevR family CRISPR-associated autoregulator [Sulfolobales archaeon]